MVKVKGGFKPGSFEVGLVLDWINANPTTATIAATLGVTSIGATITGLLKLFKWSKGKKLNVDRLKGLRLK